LRSFCSPSTAFLIDHCRFLLIRQAEGEAIPNLLNTDALDNYVTHLATEQEDTDGNLRAAVVAEDIYESIGHIFVVGAKHSAEEKKNSSMGHFDDFLKIYFRGKSIVPRHKDLNITDVNDALVGSFATYLGQVARTKNKKKEPLSYSTARGYFSSFKMYFLHNFRSKRTPEVFKDQKFRMYATAMTALIVERCKKTNEPLVAQKACAIKEDWVALASLCAWSGKPEMIEFWHFNNTTTQMAARGNEVAFLRHSDITPTHIEEDFQNKYTLASVFVNIWKQTSSQECHLCPHIDCWQLDWYFSDAVLLAVAGSSNHTDFVCPAYGARANKEDKRQKKNSSGVSSLWTEKFREIVKYFDEIREGEAGDASDSEPSASAKLLGGGSFGKITSHAGKQYAVQNMGASPLKIVDIIFRAGWQVRNVHTVFDYLQREGVNDLEAAKACAGWITKINDRIWGGYTNKLEDLSDSVEKFQKFCSVLFHDDGLKYVRICVAMQCLAEQCANLLTNTFSPSS
jgi:hypothetical protein